MYVCMYSLSLIVSVASYKVIHNRVGISLNARGCIGVGYGRFLFLLRWWLGWHLVVIVVVVGAAGERGWIHPCRW